MGSGALAPQNFNHAFAHTSNQRRTGTEGARRCRHRRLVRRSGSARWRVLEQREVEVAGRFLTWLRKAQDSRRTRPRLQTRLRDEMLAAARRHQSRRALVMRLATEPVKLIVQLGRCREHHRKHKRAQAAQEKSAAPESCRTSDGVKPHALELARPAWELKQKRYHPF